MATFTTATYDAQLASLADVSQRPENFASMGNLFIFREQRVLSGAEAANDIIKLGYLPKGARVISGLSKLILSGDPGTTLTFDIGTAGDPNAFGDTVVVSAGERAFLDAGTIPVAANAERLMGDANLGDDLTLLATVHSAASLTATTKVDFFIVFALPM